MSEHTPLTEAAGPFANTDRELFREGGGDGNGQSYYEPSIHVTAQGHIGMNVGGTVYTLPIREWHALAARASTATADTTQPALECDRCSDESKGLGSSAGCICGPNVPCGWCGQGRAATADTGLRERVEALIHTPPRPDADRVQVDGRAFDSLRAALDATAAPTTDTGARDE